MMKGSHFAWKSIVSQQLISTTTWISRTLYFKPSWVTIIHKNMIYWIPPPWNFISGCIRPLKNQFRIIFCYINDYFVGLWSAIIFFKFSLDLHRPSSSSCGGLLPSAKVFFLSFWQKKELIMLCWPIFGNFWCPLVTSVTFSSNLSNFERNLENRIFFLFFFSFFIII